MIKRIYWLSMKRLVRTRTEMGVIQVTMYLKPIMYENSETCAAVSKDHPSGKIVTDAPYRVINGSLSGPGEALEPPISKEWDHFIEDCRWLVKEDGFTIIKSDTSVDSMKSEYILVFGLKDEPCGTLVYDMRISDHPFDATFPDELKEFAVNYLRMNNVLDGSATQAGIDFQIEKVTVGSVKNDTWDRALNRLHDKLRKMRSAVRIRT